MGLISKCYMSISASVISLHSKYGLNYCHESRSCRFYHFDMVSNVCRLLVFNYAGNSFLGGHYVGKKRIFRGTQVKRNACGFQNI